jgi:hypothetical protein
MLRELLSALVVPSSALLVLAASASPAAAGPPAVCQPIATATEVEMPWDGQGWNAVDPEVGPEAAIDAAIRALRASDDVFAHMETLRRAVVYASGHGKGQGREKHAGSAERLVARLRADWKAAEREREADPTAERRARAALRRFDLAYAAAALEQVGIDAEVDYDRHLKEALAVRGDDARMHLGAALALWTESGKREVYGHLEAALRGADGDELLARNLATAAGRFVGTDTLDGLRREVRRELGRS